MKRIHKQVADCGMGSKRDPVFLLRDTASPTRNPEEKDEIKARQRTARLFCILPFKVIHMLFLFRF